MRRTGKIIAVTGAHGTGKTTAVYEMAAKMKRAGRHEIGLILETARRCPLPVLGRGGKPSTEAQMWLFAEQLRNEIEAVTTYARTVADRTAVDVIAYSLLCGFDALAESQTALARHHAGLYETVYFRSVSDSPFLVDDGFRSIDRESQAKVERLLVDVYAALGIPLLTATP